MLDAIEYRKRHPRCRTCQHTKDCGLMWDFWVCLAKNQKHKGKLNETKFKGMFCSAYLAKEGDKGG